MISPSSTNPKVTLGKPYIFRVCFIDPFQGKVAAEFATGKLHAKTGGHHARPHERLQHRSDAGFSGQLHQDGRQDRHHGKTTQAGDPTFKSPLTAIKALNPDVLYVPGYYNEVGTIAREAREVGLTRCRCWAGTAGSRRHWSRARAAPAARWKGPSSRTIHRQQSDPTVPRSSPATTRPPTAEGQTRWPPRATTPPGVLADAMKAAGAPAGGDYDSDAYRAKLRDAIAATKNYKGVTGDITLGRRPQRQQARRRPADQGRPFQLGGTA